ncbi:MAG: AEC family transporter [Clostridia bacterium]|nr:AEC family transporter [Clostridia bacterium]
MGSTTVLNQVIILFLIMLIGFYARKREIINDSVSKKLSELLLKITSPLLVISSFQVSFTQEILNNVIIVFIFSMAAHAISALLGQVLFQRSKESTRKIMKFSAIYSNCGFMGFPLLESLFGKAGVLFGSVYVAAFNIFLWTNGVMIFNNQKKLDRDTIRKALFNPGIVSVIIGMLLFLFSIKLPYPAARTVELVGSMTTPLSMLIVGANLAGCDFRKLLYGFELYYVTAVRLLFIPVLTYMLLKLLGFSGTLLGTCVLLVAMPVAATTTIFAEMYEGDTLFASRVVAFSTLASIFTIPMIMLLQ